MVTDKFGCRAFAQHELIDGETQKNVTNAISAFKRSSKSWNDIKVIIIDEDFTELSTIEVEFPEASIILCHFHVIDYLKREISRREYGFTSYERLHLKTFITMMVRATTETLFDYYLNALKELCRGQQAFVEYLETNWLSCKKRWCTFHRGAMPHLDSNTNNRLQASWGSRQGRTLETYTNG
ncbi:hypothetical protein PC116_g27270 [Phytophthora cactorum]|nr:hypothetical protein PC116_g27270 [Phytophthora cactorum]